MYKIDKRRKEKKWNEKKDGMSGEKKPYKFVLVENKSLISIQLYTLHSFGGLLMI